MSDEEMREGEEKEEKSPIRRFDCLPEVVRAQDAHEIEPLYLY